MTDMLMFSIAMKKQQRSLKKQNTVKSMQSEPGSPGLLLAGRRSQSPIAKKGAI